VRKLIDLEGFGLPSTTPEQAPKRYRRWMDEIRTPMGMKTYATLQKSRSACENQSAPQR
jgi:hypothetical protein